MGFSVTVRNVLCVSLSLQMKQWLYLLIMISIMSVGYTLFPVRMLTEHRAVCSKQIVMCQYSIWSHNAAWKYPKIVISENFFEYAATRKKNLQKKVKRKISYDIKKNKNFFF